jgi:alkylation response protein AidB-like acyl-CoA dehydrogenase
MNFDFSEEQTQLREALTRLLERSHSFDKRKQIVAAAESPSPLWPQLAELGAFAVAIPERFGGLGGTSGTGCSAVDTLVIMEAFGRRLVVEPYLATIVLGAGLIIRAGSESQCAEMLPRVASGSLRLALAHDELDSRYELSHVTTTARRDATGYILDGHKCVVLGGGAAEKLIVTARSEGAPGDRGGITLFVVAAETPGVEIKPYRTQDSHRAADITFAGVRVAPEAVLGPVGAGLALVEHAVEHAIAAVCAEALGALATLLDVTSAFVKTRKQFGVPIGQFQVLQHRLADMLMRVEQARSMAYLAASSVDGDDEVARRKVISAAKVIVGQAARFVGQQAVQLHGAIGMTDESEVSHYFKRLTMIELSFGDSAHHLAQFSDSMIG